MANEGFNGSTITFGSSLAPLRSIRHSNSSAKVDITGCADTIKTYEGGIPDLEVTVDIVGVTAIEVGATPAAITIAWSGATSTAHEGADAGTWRPISVEVSGDMDGEIISSIVFVPATKAA